MADILFYSSMDGYRWGGSEDLWAGASLRLAARGSHRISACVAAWNPEPAEWGEFHDAQINIIQRSVPGIAVRVVNAVARRVGRRPTSHLRRAIAECHPRLVVISNGGTLPSSTVMEELLEAEAPFVNIAQANREDYFADDLNLDLTREYVAKARRMVFVSRANRDLFERQIAQRIGNDCIARNPYKVSRASDFSPIAQQPDAVVKFACVGRLHPASKGQDVLLEVLSQEHWRDREWSLSFFGAGPQTRLVSELVHMFGLSQRVSLAGLTRDVEGIWRSHEVLALPSRYEGLPLAVVEAMLCGRVVVTTNAGGAKELITDGESGFIANGTHLEAFSAAMERAWRSRGQWAAIGKAARARALQEIGADPCGDLAALIETLL